MFSISISAINLVQYLSREQTALAKATKSCY